MVINENLVIMMTFQFRFDLILYPKTICYDTFHLWERNLFGRYCFWGLIEWKEGVNGIFSSTCTFKNTHHHKNTTKIQYINHYYATLPKKSCKGLWKYLSTKKNCTLLENFSLNNFKQMALINEKTLQNKKQIYHIQLYICLFHGQAKRSFS